MAAAKERRVRVEGSRKKRAREGAPMQGLGPGVALALQAQLQEAGQSFGRKMLEFEEVAQGHGGECCRLPGPLARRSPQGAELSYAAGRGGQGTAGAGGEGRGDKGRQGGEQEGEACSPGALGGADIPGLRSPASGLRPAPGPRRAPGPLRARPLARRRGERATRGPGSEPQGGEREQKKRLAVGGSGQRPGHPRLAQGPHRQGERVAVHEEGAQRRQAAPGPRKPESIRRG